jgi:hypothetical protein
VSALRDAYRAAIEHGGETFAIGGLSRKGVFSLLRQDQAEALFAPSTLADLPRPLFKVHVAHDDPAAEAQVVARGASNYEIRHVHMIRFGNELIGKLLVIG